MLAVGEELVEATDMHRVSGLETWFSLPGRTAPAPPKWKMFLVSVAVIYALQLAVNLVLGPARWRWPCASSSIAVAVTALMTWLVMPRAARLLQDWLYAPPRRLTTPTRRGRHMPRFLVSGIPELVSEVSAVLREQRRTAV